MSLKIVSLHQSAVHTPKSVADTLRKLAADIENGKLEAVERLHILIEHTDGMLTFAPVGKTSDRFHQIGVFSTAAAIAIEYGVA